MNERDAVAEEDGASGGARWGRIAAIASLLLLSIVSFGVWWWTRAYDAEIRVVSEPPGVAVYVVETVLTSAPQEGITTREAGGITPFVHVVDFRPPDVGTSASSVSFVVEREDGEQVVETVERVEPGMRRTVRIDLGSSE